MWTTGIRAHNGLFSFCRENYTDYYRKEVDLVAGSWHF